MKKFYPRYFLMLLALIVFGIAMPLTLIKTECLAAGGRVIYTAATGGTSDDSGDGTKSNPYNLFDTALKNAKDGDTIYILEPMAFLNASDNSPYIIDKAVTIKGNGNVFLIRPAGIVLGADVTFENVVLNFGNRYHDALFANGHTLTLKNVSCESGARQVDIFGGGLYMNGKAVAQPGNDAHIIMTSGGGNFGNIYAGSMNGVYSGNVTISLTNLKAASNMVVYASGASETYVNVDDFFNLEEPVPPTANKNYTISGNVNITVNDCNICQIEQISADASASCNLVVHTNGKYNGLIAARNMDLITVKGGGTFAPTELTEGTSVTLTGGSSLDLTNISQPVISQLISESSTNKNRLVLGENQYLTIKNSLKGNFIFETENGYNGYSGMTQYNFAYIRLETSATSNNATFSFTCIPGLEVTLDKTSNYTVSGKTYSVVWKTSEEPDYHPFPVKSLEITNPTIITTVSGFSNAPVFYAKVTAPDDMDPYDCYFDLVPIRYEIVYNNTKYTAEAEFDGYGYTAHIPELRLSMFALSDQELVDSRICVYTYMDGSGSTPLPPAAGTYDITLLPLSTGEQVSATARLVIMEDSVNVPDTVITQNTNATLSLSTQNATINDSITISSVVKNQDNTNALNAPVSLYINGIEYKGANLTTSSGKVSCTLKASPENGFVVGRNDISIVYKGASDGQTASALSQGTASISLKQVSTKISHSANNKSYTFTGMAIPYIAGTVKITDTNNNVLVKNIIPEIYYKKDGIKVTPIEPGTYDVFFRVTDELYGTMETKAATMTIVAATPKVFLTGKVSSGKKVTLHAVVNTEGCTSIPVGVINFYMNGRSMGQVNLSYGEASVSKQLKAGTYTFIAKYEPAYGDKTPFYTSQQSMEVKIVITSEGNTEITTSGSTENVTEGATKDDSEDVTTDDSEDETDSKDDSEDVTTDDSENETDSKDDSEELTTNNTEDENDSEEDSETDPSSTSGEDTEENSQESSDIVENEDKETQENAIDGQGSIPRVIFIVIGVVTLLIVSAAVFGCVWYIRKKKVADK